MRTCVPSVDYAGKLGGLAEPEPEGRAVMRGNTAALLNLPA